MREIKLEYRLPNFKALTTGDINRIHILHHMKYEFSGVKIRREFVLILVIKSRIW